MLMAPPQGNPAFQATSSATPNLSTFGRLWASTSAASVITSTSTQPPETDPSKQPLGATTSWPPTGTGEDPQVQTTVARAASPYLSSQWRAIARAPFR